jgi:hypothetical protein
MERIPVQSSNISSVGYDPARKVLEVEFRGKGKNRVYQYQDVPAWIFDDLISGDFSVGKYHREAVVKGGYRHEEIIDEWPGENTSEP